MTDEGPPKTCCLRPGESLRIRLARQGMRFDALWGQMRRLGAWLEAEALPAAAEVGLETARLEVGRREITLLGVRLRRGIDPLDNCAKLCQFLEQLGITRLVLDPRLESNQMLEAEGRLPDVLVREEVQLEALAQGLVVHIADPSLPGGTGVEEKP